MKKLTLIMPLIAACFSEPEQIEPDSDADTPYCIRVSIASDDDYELSLGVLCFELRYVCLNVREGLIDYGSRVGVIQVGECS